MIDLRLACVLTIETEKERFVKDFANLKKLYRKDLFGAAATT